MGDRQLGCSNCCLFRNECAMSRTSVKFHLDGREMSHQTLQVTFTWCIIKASRKIGRFKSPRLVNFIVVGEHHVTAHGERHLRWKIDESRSLEIHALHSFLTHSARSPFYSHVVDNETLFKRPSFFNCRIKNRLPIWNFFIKNGNVEFSRVGCEKLEEAHFFSQS